MKHVIGLAATDLSATQQAELGRLAESLGAEFRRLPEGYVADLYDDVTGLIGFVSAEELERMRSLQWMQIDWAGVDKIVGAPCFQSGKVTLCNASGAFGVMIAEHLLGGVLTLYKRFDGYRAAQAHGEWIPSLGADSLHGKRVTVVGLGDIGSTFARYCAALGAHVTGVAQREREKPEYLERFLTAENLREAVRGAQVLVLCLPNTAKTKHLIGDAELSLLARGALVLNAGRGATLDQAALESMLAEGTLGGAVLDVFEQEPLPNDSPLWRMPNVLLTPHVSGHSADEANRARIGEIVTENLRRYLSGEPLLHVVDPKRGY
ncbi:MAG: D-2-hydroxyacid dehydrogenase [Clostridia bacterium]|nr:D-2-hydroxyacid dehydrogenase [Clostridia bacterium]